MDKPDRLATQEVANRGVGGMIIRSRALVHQC
jgi:hypothetical protein